MVMKRLKKFLKRRTEPQKPPEVEVKRQHSLQDDYDEAMMAVTFAEAGAPEQAVEVMRQYGKRKILVVSQEDAFTEAVMEYATQLAERMGYDLIALNVGAATSDKGLVGLSAAYAGRVPGAGGTGSPGPGTKSGRQEHPPHPRGEIRRGGQGGGKP